MDSTVKVCLFSILIGFASAAIDADCQFVGEFCDPEDSQADPFTLSDAATDMATAIDECYDQCNLEKAAASPCLSFTVRKTGNRPPGCFLLRSDCVLNSADACLSSDPASCASGPSDCSTFIAEVCPKVVVPEGDYARWQCQDINTNFINPYNEDPPEGTVCYQTCSSWVFEENTAGPPGQLVSTCEGGVWTPTKSSDPNDADGALFYPEYPDGSTYPTPNAAAATTLPCGCQPLNVQWPYGPVADPATQVWYDPNREEAAEFICETTVNMANKDYMIVTTNTCVLYCDDHYVATATCLDGQWSGNPEWGFWCYEEPIAIA
eukprot:TRINITY_DN54_c0_g1_i4.p1 TRINITY_DN54_c0_g1~~TRINITY_DN54_c0_g1_i4.p1  ORF type:complete len:329 (+),score=56.96 TRINITY_DN54_c0_g1_i4:25-987(+)